MRVLVISDIHANYVALEAVLADAHGRYDIIWNLGDTIGYGPRPNECMDRMLALNTIMIAGNHDLACIGSTKVNIDEFNPDAKSANIWNGNQLTAEHRQTLAELPLAKAIDPSRYYIVHGSPLDPVWEYLLQPSQAASNWQSFAQQVCFIGHSHVQIFIRRHSDGQIEGPTMPARNDVITFADGERYFINPGSVGQPRDGDPRAAYAIVDTDAHELTFGRVNYDIGLTQRQMLEHNLPINLIRRLQFGR